MQIEKDQLITIAVVTVLVAGFVAGVYYPSLAKREQIEARIETAKQDLGIKLGEDRKLKAWYTQVVDLRRRVNEQPGRVPETSELASVLEGLSNSLEMHGVGRQEVLTREIRDYAHYSVIPIRLAFNGSFPVAFGVLEQIQSMDRLMRVDRLDMRHLPNTSASSLDVRIELSTFYSDEVANTGARR